MMRIAESLAEIAGLRVTMAGAELDHFVKDASGFAGHRPLALVRPGTVPALVALVRKASLLGVRLQPISSTGSHHRGDTLCRSGSIVVDMSGFDTVVRVDRRNRVALFEAGVTFAQLEKALHARGLRAMLPLCPRPGKSALAAYLEREPTMYPRFQWDLSDPLLCVEAVFGTGEVFRTGAAAGPGTLEEQWASGNAQKTPLGPGHSDIVRIMQGAQGNLGIVTWCTAKAEPMPRKETLYRLSSPELGKLLDLTYRLLSRGLPDICFIVDDPALAALQRDDRQTGAALWHLVFSLSAPQLLGEEKLEWVQDDVMSLCCNAGLAAQLQDFAPRHENLHLRLLHPNSSQHADWWKNAAMPATRELFFQTTLDRCNRFVPTAQRHLQQRRWSGRPLTYIQPQLGGRCCHMEFIFPHDPTHQAAQGVSQMVNDLAAELKTQGAFFSRPYGPLIDLARADLGTDPMIDRLTDIFDPAGVMAASVWPMCRRRTGAARTA